MCNIFYTIAFLFILSVSIMAETPDELYKRAVIAKTIGERDELVEKSLEGYLKIENDNSRQNIKNGYLYYNIGNCYFILNQLGKSILYYEEALKLLPNEENIRLNLETALSKRVNAYDYSIPVSLKNVFFFHYELVSSVKAYIMVASSILILLFVFVLKAQDKMIFRMLIGLLLCVYLSLFSSVIYSYYAPLIKGVMNEASLVHKEPSENYSSVTKLPVGEGSRVKVLKFSNDWVQVQLNDGLTGYVKRSSLDIIL